MHSDLKKKKKKLTSFCFTRTRDHLYISFNEGDFIFNQHLRLKCVRFSEARLVDTRGWFLQEEDT